MKSQKIDFITKKQIWILRKYGFYKNMDFTISVECVRDIKQDY